MVKRVSTLSQVLKETAPQQEQQQDNTVLPQNDNTTITQKRTRKSDERDKVTYYLEPGQLDKLEDLRIAYRKATGNRLNEQDFMRMIVDRIDLQILL